MCACFIPELFGGATMITEADIAGIQCPYEGRAVALALWNERVRENVAKTPQEEWDAPAPAKTHCAYCGSQPDVCGCTPAS